MTSGARRTFLTTAEFYRLNHACLPLLRAFKTRTYLVGSSSNPEKQGFRDVDVRTILDDEDWDALFADRADFWSLFCLGIATYLTEVSGLPIDYQVQRMTEANERFDGPRNPIGVPRYFAGMGDATAWTGPMSRGEEPDEGRTVVASAADAGATEPQSDQGQSDRVDLRPGQPHSAREPRA